jgi:D-tyrosyl-tRNA(Tyr) deacylase
MKFIIQRVRKSSVQVRGKIIGAIDKGLLVLAGIKKGDTKADAEWMIRKLLKMRIFEDEESKMNKSVSDVKGSLLLVPNFTLYADVRQGNRPGFSEAEAPGRARELFDQLIQIARESTDLKVETGEFGAHMDVSLSNDGPVTIIVES